MKINNKSRGCVQRGTSFSFEIYGINNILNVDHKNIFASSGNM